MMTPRFRHLPRHPQAALSASPRPAGATLTVQLGPVTGAAIARVPRFAVAAAPVPPAAPAPAAVKQPAATGSQETLRVILSGLVEELSAEAPVSKGTAAPAAAVVTAEKLPPAAVATAEKLPAARGPRPARQSRRQHSRRRQPFRRPTGRVHHGSADPARQALLPAA